MRRRVASTRRRFGGTLEQLDAVLVAAGKAGWWEWMPAGYWRFNDTSGAILNWWTSTGTLDFQGTPAARAAFEQSLITVVSTVRKLPGPATA